MGISPMIAAAAPPITSPQGGGVRVGQLPHNANNPSVYSGAGGGQSGVQRHVGTPKTSQQQFDAKYYACQVSRVGMCGTLYFGPLLIFPEALPILGKLAYDGFEQCMDVTDGHCNAEYAPLHFDGGTPDNGTTDGGQITGGAPTDGGTPSGTDGGTATGGEGGAGGNGGSDAGGGSCAPASGTVNHDLRVGGNLPPHGTVGTSGAQSQNNEDTQEQPCG